MPFSGETWNQFKLLRPLGKGGMGEVFLAEDSSLDRKVALKFLPDTLQNEPEARERFLQEAKNAAALDHPYICKIYEIGEVKGKAYIAMEYVEGPTLQEKLALGPMRLPELLQVGAEMAEAVEAAHKKMIVHRDIKTPNIKVTPDGHIKVMDFGLAKQIALEEGFESKVDTFSGRATDPSASAGTVFYMSPEQVRGEPVDSRTDIFSMGVVLYEMATGKLPFEGATSGLTYDAILNRGPTPPRQVNPNLPVELEQIIHKALEKDRQNRYQSAKELMVDLKRLKRDTDSSRPGMPAAVEEPPAAKKKSMWRWAAVAVLALAVLALWFFWPSGVRDGEAIDSLAVLPFENTSNDPEVDYLSDGIAESLIDRLSQIPQLQVMARSTAFRYRGSDTDPLTAGRELGVGAVVTGRVVQRDDMLNVHAELVDVKSGRQIWGQSYDREMADLVSVQNDIAQEIKQALRLQLSGEQPPTDASMTANSDAYQAYLKGRFFWNKRTNEDFKKAIAFFEQAIDKDPDYALAHVGLADCYSLLGSRLYGVDEDFPPKQAFEEARSAALEALRLDDTLAEARATLGWIRFIYDWDWEGAEKEFQSAIRLDPRYVTAHQWYSVFLPSLRRHDEGIEEARRALELEPVSPLQNRGLGIAFYRAKRYPEAIEQFEKTLELAPSYPLAREMLINSYWLNGMQDEAVAVAQRVNPDWGRFYQLVKDGKRDEAVQLLTSLPDNDQLLFVTRYLVAGDKEEVLERLERAFEERDPQLVLTLASPEFDTLRSNPRFEELLRRMNLPD